MQKVALVGNPNSGKSSLFNQLTGLNQKTGNYPGVTVEQMSGEVHLDAKSKIKLIDLPGAYSIHPTSYEERVVTQVLTDRSHPDHPELVIYVLDVQEIEKQSLLLSQISSLQIPLILVLNKSDLRDQSPFEYDKDQIAKKLEIPVIEVSRINRRQVAQLKAQIEMALNDKKIPNKLFDDHHFFDQFAVELSALNLEDESYISYLRKVHAPIYQNTGKSYAFDTFVPLQVEETLSRFEQLQSSGIFKKKSARNGNTWHDKIDPLLTHPILGPFIFLLLMIGVFQVIYHWAAYPMEWIEWAFNESSEVLAPFLGSGWFSSLVLEGIIPGIAGVMVFIPQIALLFFMIAILEETGYMARIAYLLDHLMRRFGMSGRSMVALISGGACAIPAIMSTRTINSPKERLITILVTPFIGCSARLPIYIVLISFAVPSVLYFGFLDSRVVLFIMLYLLGIIAALGTGYVLKRLFHNEALESHFIIELPEYKLPHLKSVGITMWVKTKSFITEAGKIIFFISIILWFLAKFGPPGEIDAAIANISQQEQFMDMTSEEIHKAEASAALRASFIGRMGTWIEPVIRPLGFDWKIGIGLISSFAAREVFVGTMSTIYSLDGEEEEESLLKEKMKNEVHRDSGKPVYTYAASLSLLVFYVFAMQCMSTLAVVKRETGSWRYPILQFVFMTALAYICSFIVYQSILLLF